MVNTAFLPPTGQSRVKMPVLSFTGSATLSMLPHLSESHLSKGDNNSIHYIAWFGRLNSR